MFKLVAVLLRSDDDDVRERPAEPEISESGRHQDDGGCFGSESKGNERRSDDLHRG